MSDLQSIKGVGNSLEKQLQELGIESVNDLANTPLDLLTDEDIRGAEKIHERAKRQGVQIKSGETVEQEQSNAQFVSTGIDDLDFILDGGLQGGFLIGVSGEHKAGKTQLALQCLASAADAGENCVYIETEPNRFQVDRIKTLCEKEGSYKRIHKIEAYSADEETDNLELQKNSYKAIKDSFDEVSLVVVDSFVSNFRLSGRFEGRGDLKERSNIIGNHLNALQSLANTFDIPVLITLQVYGNPQQYSSSVPVYGGALMHHTLSYILHMAHGKGELRKAQLKGHPSKPDNEVELQIPEDAPIKTAN